MSKNVNVPIANIDTEPAKKSLKDLRKEIKDLKDQMVNLEEGSDAFLEAANKAGELKHQIDEINESVKGASSDFGDMVGNIANVTAGMVGAFSAINGGLQALGIESKAIDETIKKIQGLIAVVQGLSQIDKAVKSLDKLRNSITSTSRSADLLRTMLKPGPFILVTAAIGGLIAIFNRWKKQEDEVKDAIKRRREELEKVKIEKIVQGYKDYNDELERNISIQNAYYQGYYKGDRESQLLKEIEATQQVINELSTQSEAGLRSKIADLNETIARYTEADQEYWNLLVEITHYEGEISNFSRRSDEERKVANENYADWLKKLKDLETQLKVLRNIERGEQDMISKRTQHVGELIGGTIVPLQVKPVSEQDLIPIGERMGKAIADAEIKARNQEWKDRMQEIEDAGNSLFEGIKESMGAFSDSSLGLTSGWIASLDQFQKAFQDTMKIVKDEGSVSWESYAGVAATALGGIGTMLNALSQEQDVSTKEGFEQQKKLQISATVMNMLSGIMAAWTSSMALPAPASFITGAVQTAATAALGAAQIAKIKSQTMDSAIASGAINASPSAIASTIIPPVQYSAAVQGAQTEGAIKNTKVYVTESDITNTVNKVSVQENENTW